MSDWRASSELDALNKEYAAALRTQIDEAIYDAQVKRREADEAADYAGRLQDVLRSVEALQGLHSPERVTVIDHRRASEQNMDPVLSKAETVVAQVREIEYSSPPPPKIAPYIPAIGGKRLKSKLMIFDLLKTINEPVTRDQLRQLFFDHYGREDLKRYWRKPDNALATAIDRAVADHYIETIEAEGRDTLYTIGWKDTETGAPAFAYGEDD
jgi:hypothetical protein